MIKIIKANGIDEMNFINLLNKRADEENCAIIKTVADIISDVKLNGDSAVRDYTAKFDCDNAEFYEVSKEIIEKSEDLCDNGFICSLKNAAMNIEAFHRQAKSDDFEMKKTDGSVLSQTTRGLSRVGIYVPGGTAAYPSSVLMNVIPAKIAGVGEIIMVTPPQKDGKANMNIIAAAKIAGADRVFLIGGAQAVAALAYGTETIPAVDKITGPGNAYVAEAKRQVFGKVDIDMIAGPSEILILADKTANPKYIAADLMSQAEHDVLASAVLITNDENIANETKKELETQIKSLSRKDMIEKSLKNYGCIIIADSIDKMIELANEIAPEHLEVCMENPMQYKDLLINAGAIFFGNYTPEPIGDYYAGPNHVLPTNGTARFSSPLFVSDFVKKSNYIYYTKDAFVKAAADVITLADKEGLDAHANSIKVRCD